MKGINKKSPGQGDFLFTDESCLLDTATLRSYNSIGVVIITHRTAFAARINQKLVINLFAGLVAVLVGAGANPIAVAR